MTKAQAEKIVKMLDEIDVSVYVDDIKEKETFDDLAEFLLNNDYLDEEVIYYSNAMQYLLDNDPSLKESLNLADEMGYQLKDLSSELLATLLKSQNLKDSFYELQKDIEEVLE